MAERAPTTRKSAASLRKRSPYAAILGSTVVVEIEGEPRRVSEEVRLQFRLFDEGLKGGVGAVREIIKMINERDAARQRLSNPSRFAPPLRQNPNPQGMSDALILLGIASKDDAKSVTGQPPYLWLEAWAAMAAIQRYGNRALRKGSWPDLRSHTRDGEALTWPQGD